MATKEQVRELLIQRQLAFKRTFNTDNQDAKAVLEDLARFCRAEETCFHADPRIHAVLEGRREVYLRILKHINLTTGDFLKYYNMEDKK